MSEQAFERKKDFVNHALSRCVAAMYPNVCRVAYHTRDTDEGLRETAMIHLAGGYSRRVDVTGLDLPATLDAVLAVFVIAIPLWYAFTSGYPLPGFCKYI